MTDYISAYFHYYLGCPCEYKTADGNNHGGVLTARLLARWVHYPAYLNKHKEGKESAASKKKKVDDGEVLDIVLYLKTFDDLTERDVQKIFDAFHSMPTTNDFEKLMFLAEHGELYRILCGEIGLDLHGLITAKKAKRITEMKHVPFWTPELVN